MNQYCRCDNIGGDSAPVDPANVELSGTGTIPSEATGETKTITADPEEAANARLERGQYRLQWIMPISEEQEPVLERDETRAVKYRDEYKRYHVYKLEILPLEERDENGQRLGRFRAVIHVLDNPLPLVPIVWGLTAVAGAGSAWFVIDKLETFTESSGGTLTITLAILGVLFFLIRQATG